ncbi:hypothetical protein HAX54_048573, partial [Datura stramonium]|nr:hypothetical protein [Datura stramonium]
MWLHLREFRSNYMKKYWARLFGGLREGDVEWIVRELIPKDNIVCGRNISFLLLAELEEFDHMPLHYSLWEYYILSNVKALGVTLEMSIRNALIKSTTAVKPGSLITEDAQIHLLDFMMFEECYSIIYQKLVDAKIIYPSKRKRKSS